MQSQGAKSFFFRMFCGFFIGISVIAPGVSGSVMAVMMGIYDRLIGIISNPFKNFKENVIYMLPMGIGALASALLFIKIFDLLFEYYPTPGYFLFIGLIAGSLPTVLKEANQGPFKKRYSIAVLGALLFAFGVGMINKSNIFISADTENFFYLALCGGIAGAASMIPGMSVSMMLIMLGIYSSLLKSASNFDVLPLIPVGICFLIGMMLFSKLIKFIFDRYHNFGYFMVFGFIIGSIVCIFPGIPRELIDYVFSLVMISVGLSIAFLFNYLGKKFNRA